MVTHSSILAWSIPWTRGTWQATVHGLVKSWTRLSNWACLSTGPFICHSQISVIFEKPKFRFVWVFFFCFFFFFEFSKSHLAKEKNLFRIDMRLLKFLCLFVNICIFRCRNTNVFNYRMLPTGFSVGCNLIFAHYFSNIPKYFKFWNTLVSLRWIRGILDIL